MGKGREQVLNINAAEFEHEETQNFDWKDDQYSSSIRKEIMLEI